MLMVYRDMGSVHMIIIVGHTVEKHLTGESQKGPQETIV